MKYFILSGLLIGSFIRAMDDNRLLEQNADSKEITIFRNKTQQSYYCIIHDSNGNNLIQSIDDSGVKKLPSDLTPYYAQLKPSKSLQISWPRNAKSLHLKVWEHNNLISRNNFNYHILSFDWLKHQQEEYELKPEWFHLKNKDAVIILTLFLGSECRKKQNKLQFRKDSGLQEIMLPKIDAKIIEKDDKSDIEDAPLQHRRTKLAMEQRSKSAEMIEKYLNDPQTAEEIK